MRNIVLGIALGLIGVVAYAAPIKSMLGADGVERVEIDELQNPYITDGLVAMWDGEWNVEFGVHDETSPVWKDLIGNLDMTLGEYGEWENNALVCLGGRIPAYGKYSLLTADGDKCVTVVAESISDSGIIFAAGNGASTGAILFEKKPSYLYMSIANYAADGTNNVVTVSDSSFSATGNWLKSDLIDAFVNGEWKTPRYRFNSLFTTRVCVGDRVNDSSKPFTGRVFHIRVYDRNLTAEEVEYNYAIDAERFGL